LSSVTGGKYLTSGVPNVVADKPHSLTSIEIEELLSKTLIANLATIDDDDSVHIIPMWFLRVGNSICIPTSRHTHKYKNLCARPRASVMIDISREGLNLKGVLIRGRVELLEGEEAQKINHAIHLKYVTPEGLENPSVVSYLSKGDDVTLKIQLDHIISWNLADSKAGKALVHGLSRPLDA
jgi:nitroimidazol reductase NimA-like FMN-containing flavoprotein (pyridoxamine 5'-phosphate oxidase superfamily)